MDKNTDKQQEQHVDEGAKVKMEGHLLIRDAETGEELVNKRNAIHFGNMAFVIANALSYWQTENNGIYHMAFGNGGSDVLNTGEINYKSTNTGTIRDDSAELYNRTYEKLIGQSESTDSKNNVSIVTSSSSYTDLQITCTLDFGEPSSQTTSDTATSDSSTDFIFDELGIYAYNSGGITSEYLLTHVIFHPVQKSLNRVIEIVYTIRVQLQ
tara:strand:+ start:130 stop:762 length:633 start_codon:yes stop_codon:yes gene_type:complete